MEERARGASGKIRAEGGGSRIWDFRFGISDFRFEI